MNAIGHRQTTSDNLVLLGGQIIFNETDTESVYQVLAGEVLILRGGHVVDLIEANEVIDAGIWGCVTAIAWTDCVLQRLSPVPQTTRPRTQAAVVEGHLALAA